MTASDCPFCDRISRGEYDYFDESSVAFRPLSPVAPGHFLVVPRRHVTDAISAPRAAARALRLAGMLAKDMGIGAANFITSAGAEATQSVFHLHVHCVPRREGDGLALPRTGQKEREQAIVLLEQALFLRQNGERPPGGNETWHDWDGRAERFLRGLLPPEREAGAP